MTRQRLPWLAAAAGLCLFAAMLLHERPQIVSAKQTNSSAPPQVSVTRQNGQLVLHLSPRDQKHLGIASAPLVASRARTQSDLPAVVLPVADLQNLVSAYDAADAQLQKAKISASVTRREYLRLKKLYSQQQNASAKAVESAAGAYRADAVDVRLAQQNLALATAAVRQNWGSAIAAWLPHNNARLNALLGRNDVLIQMTVPLGQHIAAPPSIAFPLPTGGRASARFLSSFPQLDPRVQGVSYLYIAPAHPGLAPGLNLVARFGAGKLHSGVIVPASAIVWLNGKAWLYQQTQPGTFIRRPVPTTVPVPGGWFVAHGFAPGAAVVTRDAQQLLGVEHMHAPSHAPAKGDAN